MHKKNSEKMLKLNAQRSATAYQKAMETIELFKKNGTPLSVSLLSKETGLSSSYFYKQKEIRKALNVSGYKAPAEYIGETSISKRGQKMTIIAYRRNADIDVQFEDGYIRKHAFYKSFKDGSLINPHFRVKEVSAINGQKMTLLSYKNAHDVSVMFEDGTVVAGIDYSNYLKGNVKNPNFKYSSKYEVGSSFVASNGISFVIIDKRGSNDMDIEFEDGTVLKNIKTCAVSTRNIKYPTINNRGYGTFCNFEVARSFKEGEDVFYKCRCKSCNMEDILTPKQMKKHFDKCFIK